MRDVDHIEIQAWVDNWKELGPILERLRVEEYRSGSLAETLLSLSDVTEAALKANPPQPYSGMIEMQRLFAKLRRNETRP
jgi:hypothetical protein